MDRNDASVSTWDEALAVLGVSASATPEQVRAAYLEKVRQHPPDRDPEQFERVRDAYGRLRDPRSRINLIFEGPDPYSPLVNVLGPKTSPRRYAGTVAWMAVLKEKRA